jgi:urocanate hydratase
LRYFEPKHHAELFPEFKAELETSEELYVSRPDYKIYARQFMNIQENANKQKPLC